MGYSRPLLLYFRLFKQTLQFLQQIKMKNVHPVYGAGIRTPPITTRPRLSPKYY